MKEGYLPKNERKKILLLSDDARLPSGIGVASKELIIGTSHHFNWIQLGAAINHPEAGKVFDLSDAINADAGIPDSSVKLYPYGSYGDQNILRQLISIEKPDAILHFTDPRFWLWLYNMEHEIRSKIPIMFYSIWDSDPAPVWNRNYYKSCDALFCISKQTYNLVKQVLGPENVVVLPYKTNQEVITNE